jgi:RHS repeat-associated protein
VAQTYGPGSNGDYFAYDVLGRATLKIQQIGAVNYQSSVTFKLAGVVSTLTYPSGHTVSHLYDQAGRLSSLSGNLGDGTTRTYATGILYSPAGAMVKEEFGTAVPVYNKLFYNSRSQLAEIRASTSYTGPTDYDANRGAIINSYSTQCAGICLGVSTPDNNGNLKRQDIEIPSAPTRSQFFEYDSLNRLLKVRETISAAEQWRQWFKYDRWGNRTIDTTIENGQSRTYGLGINNKAFTVDPANNRLGVPAGQSGAMSYDASGNLTNDTYTGAGNRTYDGENKITSAWGGLNQAQLYSYDSSGGRVKRIVNGVETWQVYGFGSELLAEYAAGGPPTSPQKEFAYRNGDLVVTAQPATVASVNVALAANGATASASSAYGGFAPSGAINGDRKGLFVWQNGYWSTAATGTAWLEVLFNGAKTISEIDVVTIQDNFNAPVEPTDTMTFANYGLSGFDVQYWNGSAWTTISGASVSGNTKIWRKFSFSPLTTTKIRVLCNASVDGFSRLTEVEAWTGPSPAPRFDLALGATATASSSWSSGWGPSAVVNGDRKSLNAGNGGAWVDAGPANSFPDWVQIDFGATKTVAEVDVFTLQDNYAGSSEPTESMTFTQWGLTSYAVEYWGGSNWVQAPGASVTGNNKIWKKFTFSPITTSKIRVVTNASVDGFSRLTEIEAYGPAESSSTTRVNWLVTDQLGTPRMIFDQSGNLSAMKRHDFLPFGEEIVSPVSGRSAAQGYSGGDGVRQQFTAKERDFEIGLDFFGARYFSSTQGRFTGADPAPIKKKHLLNPQDLNRYSYVANNPLAFVDPNGEEKIQVIIRTFIPQKTVSAPGVPTGSRTFEGDNRGVGKPGTYRTEQIITIETDPKKNNGNPIYGKPERNTGTTVERGLFWNSTGKASGETLEAQVGRNEDTVNIQAKGNESNPLVLGSPGVTYDLMIGIKSDGPKGEVTVNVSGQHDGFPAYEVLIVRPESGDNAEHLVYGYDSRTTGQTAASLLPPAEVEVKKQCVQRPGGECQ